MKISHLTSVHGRRDTRIFLKECRSLANHGYDVTLIVADSAGNEISEGVKILDVGRPSGRLHRMLVVARRIFTSAIQLDADIYHLHDPELLVWGFFLRMRGKHVIYDAHEDLAKDILSKYYLPKWIRAAVATLARHIEFAIARRLGSVVAATPAIRDNFIRSGIDCVDINNYPILDELSHISSDMGSQKTEVSFVGGMTSIRGIYELVEACKYLKTSARLNLVGEFADDDLSARVHSSEGWSRVNVLGYLSRDGISRIMSRSAAGIVTFLPEPSHIEAQPNKMFEYMSAGIPVIASDFPLWREIIEGHECGVLVDPSDSRAIAAAIDHFVSNPQETERRGRNGINAVQRRFNWSMEEKKLFLVYSEVSSSK